jgi:hypothetical protein
VTNDSIPKLAARPWRYALATSAALHSVLLVGTALCALHLRTPAVDAGRVEAAFSTPEVGDWVVVPPVRLIESDPADGGRTVEGRAGAGQELTDLPSLPGTDDAKSSQPRLARNAQPLGSRWLSETRAQGGLTEIVGAAQGRSGSPTDGTGGAGRGGGGGKSTFFGLGASGRRIAFVVDASASMNHPYLGEAKTRIGQLKLELAKSILSLTEDQQFFIIFFNEHAIPMPADGMEHAYAANQQRFLNWVASVPASGLTDPRPALTMALSLRPDVVYLLTDGTFPRDVQGDLNALRLSAVEVNTIAIGDPRAEKLLKPLATHNGGRFTFVP